MKVFLTIVLVGLLSAPVVLTSVIKVPADQPTIQSAINVSSDGDTVLVAPGIYKENLNFSGKNITVGSFFLSNPDTSYISQTVIDGDLKDRVVTFASGEDSTTALIGFTIKNGVAHHGGGIFCNSSSPKLSNLKILNNYSTFGFFRETPGDGGGISCSSSELIIEDVIIQNNIATGGGGGIFSHDSELKLKNTRIFNNEASRNGGGIKCSNSTLNFENVTVSFNRSFEAGGGVSFENSNFNFASNNRSNIYLNVAPYGRDFQNVGQGFIEVLLDTFTVSIPSDYFAYPVEKFNFDILNSRIIQEKADLFVALSGNDDNNGLSRYTPLQTITMAVLKVVVDSLNPHTIYLQNGLYSSSTTAESYPLYFRNYISMKGENKANTILDAENESSVIYAYESDNITIENITIQHGSALRGGGAYLLNSDLTLKNIKFTENEAGTGAAIYCQNSNAKIIENEILSNEAAHAGGGVYCSTSTVTIRKNIFKTNSAKSVGGAIAGSTSNIIENIFVSNSANTGGAIHSEAMGNNHLVVRNVFTENTAIWGGAMAINWSEPKLINNTLFKNSATNGGGLFCWQNASPVLVNNILWNNEGGEIILDKGRRPASIAVRYTDIEGGWSGQGNIDADPLFADPTNQDFNLKAESPCIDVATAIFVWQGDTLVNLDPMDYVGSAPDMGAIEHDFASVIEANPQTRNKYQLFQNYPNPFNAVTTISFGLLTSTFVKLSIYNINGQLIELLVNDEMKAGNHSVRWNADRYVSGVYFYKIKAGEYSATGKALFLK